MNLNFKYFAFLYDFKTHFRGGGSGWLEWAYVHPDFGRIEGSAGQWRRAAFLLALSDFQTCAIPAFHMIHIQLLRYKRLDTIKYFLCKLGMISCMQVCIGNHNFLLIHVIVRPTKFFKDLCNAST